MTWHWWKRHKANGREADEAVRLASRQYRLAKAQGCRVDGAIRDAVETMDAVARELERAMRPRGV